MFAEMQNDDQPVEFEDLFEALDERCPLGYTLVSHIRMASPTFTRSTYPPEWLKAYSKGSNWLADPVVSWAFFKSGSIRWSEIRFPDPAGVMADAAKHGLKYGMAVSIGSIRSKTIGGAARADREFTDAEITEIYDIMLQLHDTLAVFGKLSKPQFEALEAFGSGKSYDQICEELNISPTALKARLTRAREHLHARTNFEALNRAQSLRLFDQFNLKKK
jgi:LuxR family transcriptional regulator, quorum-sensing system regulator SdiA